MNHPEYITNDLIEQLDQLEKSQKFIIGLTGTIASGKSSVSKFLLKYHDYEFVDADLIARQVLEKGSLLLEKVTEQFGLQILNEDGYLNRSKLGNIVFSDKEQLRKLNQITHPAILKESIKQINQSKKLMVIWDMPLLFELSLQKYMTVVLYVTADKQTRIDRIKIRNPDWSDEKINSVINSQAKFSEVEEYIDYLIENQNITLGELRKKVYKLSEELLEQATDSLTHLDCPNCNARTHWEFNPYKPFCSKACQYQDLVSWGEEKYKVPVQDKEDNEY